MKNALARSKQQLSDALVRNGTLDIEPLVADQWVMVSLLQKSIRRGDVETAQRAAFTLLGQKGSAIWRRFMVIAFEDVGAAAPDAVGMTVAASTDLGLRKTSGGDLHVAVQLARILAEAPKSRSAEHLITSAQHHPSLTKARMVIGAGSFTDHLDAVMDGEVSLAERAIASRSGEGSTIIKSEVPPSKVIDGVPMYALDKHTRLGREAIRHFALENDEVRAVLAQYVPTGRRNDAAYMAAFYADAAPLPTKLVWKGADALETLVTETDLLQSGVPPEGFAPLLGACRANLGHLDEARARVFAQQRSRAPSKTPIQPVG
jgi:hypothetical protein